MQNATHSGNLVCEIDGYFRNFFLKSFMRYTGVKKDPGVPNSFPFKDLILAEAEQARLLVSSDLYRTRWILIDILCRGWKRRRRRRSSRRPILPNSVA